MALESNVETTFSFNKINEKARKNEKGKSTATGFLLPMKRIPLFAKSYFMARLTTRRVQIPEVEIENAVRIANKHENILDRLERSVRILEFVAVAGG